MTNNYLPKNAGDYPKTSAARTFMVETANKYVNEYTEALGKLTREDKLQKKVLSIQQNMAKRRHMGAANRNKRTPAYSKLRYSSAVR